MGVGAVAVGVAFAGTLIGQWGGYPTVKSVADYGLLVFALFAAVCSALAARSAEGRQRRAWLCLTVGLVGWAGGEALWIFYERVLHQAPFPSLADASYLLFPIWCRPRDGALSHRLFGSFADSVRVRRVHRGGRAVRDVVGARDEGCLRRGRHKRFRAWSFAGLSRRRHRDPDRGAAGARKGPHRAAHDAGDADRRRRLDGVVGQRFCLSHCPRRLPQRPHHRYRLGGSFPHLRHGGADQSSCSRDRRGRLAGAVPGVDVAALRAGRDRRADLFSRLFPDARPRADPRVVDPADGRGDGEAVHGGSSRINGC